MAMNIDIYLQTTCKFSVKRHTCDLFLATFRDPTLAITLLHLQVPCPDMQVPDAELGLCTALKTNSRS